MFCVKCGAAVNGNYCSVCGYKVRGGFAEFNIEGRRRRKSFLQPYKDGGKEVGKGVYWLADCCWTIASTNMVKPDRIFIAPYTDILRPDAFDLFDEIEKTATELFFAMRPFLRKGE